MDEDTRREQRRITGLGLSLGARAVLSTDELVRLAQRVEDAVAQASLWIPEGSLRDPYPALGLLAGHTRRLLLGSGVSPLAARSAATSAMAAATLDDLSGGRAVLGLGLGHRTLNADWYGQQHRSQLQWAEEYLTAVREILAGRPSAVDGGELRSVGFALLGGRTGGPPVALAALGPKMLALAGRAADTTLLNWVTPDYAAWSKDQVTQACERDHRPNVGVYVRIAAGPGSHEAGLAHTKMFFARKNYYRSFQRMGLVSGPDPVARATDQLVLTGTTSRVAARLGEWRDAGMDFVVLYPVGSGELFRSACELALEALSEVEQS